MHNLTVGVIEAFITCPECGQTLGVWRLMEGITAKRHCTACGHKFSVEVPTLSTVHFLAMYQGGQLYAWRALESGNFPALRYGGVNYKGEANTRPTAVYNADIDTAHKPHFVGGRDRLHELFIHLDEIARVNLAASFPVPVFFLEFKGLNC